jgi:hypothetical protein
MKTPIPDIFDKVEEFDLEYASKLLKEVKKKQRIDRTKLPSMIATLAKGCGVTVYQSIAVPENMIIIGATVLEELKRKNELKKS